MPLASALLQPQRVARASAAANVRLIDDVTRMLAFLFEDAAEDGPVSRALMAAVVAMGPRLQQLLQQRVRTAAETLRIRAEGLVSSLDALGQQIDAIGEDRAKAVTLATQLLDAVEAALDAATYPGLRQRVQFVVDLLEKDLGLSAAFIDEQIVALLDDAANRIAAIEDGGDADVRRQRRACAATFRRLARDLQANFNFPGFDVDALTRALYELLRDAGVQEVIRQARCALAEFDTAVQSARTLGEAVPGGAVNTRSVGAAALVDLKGQATYAWYPSWLLLDEDLQLLGLSDLKNAAALIVAIRDSSGEVARWLHDQCSAAQLQAFAGVTAGSTPTEEQKLTVLAVLNKAIQGPLIYDSERFPSVDLPGNLREDHSSVFPDDGRAQVNATTNNDVLLSNRRFLGFVFKDAIEDPSHWFWRWVYRSLYGLIDWPLNQVSVSADKRFIMCGDKPLLMGENLKWNDAPIFASTERGQTFWIFEHISPPVCEGFAYHLAWPTTLGKAVWRLVNTIRDQPGHRVGSGIALSMEFAESLNQILFGRPVNGYLGLGWWGRWMSSGAVGPRALSIFGGSFQGMHTAATGGNIWWFWVTMFAGDVIRWAGPNSILGTLREVVLGVITLVNFGGPRMGPSALPDSPAQNHLKQGPINSLVNTLFGLWLLSYYKREDHSIHIWGKDSPDRHDRAFKLWLGGGIGMGIAAGVTTTLVAQIMAWAEDWARFGKTVGLATFSMLAQFWVLEYLQKEGDTDGGKYNPRQPGKPFKGYPDKETSPYRLPYPKGDALYCGQGNQGMWSHNDISNINKTQQCYAFDFGFDHRQGVHAARGGVVWAFSEGIDDNSDKDWNMIVIRHDTVVADHDDPYGTGVLTTYAVYGHGAHNGITDAFAQRGLAAPVQESTNPGMGTRVNQGDLIMLADDTGLSFHSHLHMHVLMDMSGGVGATGPGNIGIPFVFREVRGEGRPLNLTWYESENG